ncbi:MAG: DUF3039 domain-containing protein [Aeriscardovia sp.]|nr:DUF3039 domain-containing protein [Aeriscardovia sp.]
METSDNGPSTALKEKSEAKAEEDRLSGDFDSEKYAHYVQKDKLKDLEAGKPVVALCGKVWVPKKIVHNFPVCPECQRIYKSLFGAEN